MIRRPMLCRCLVTAVLAAALSMSAGAYYGTGTVNATSLRLRSEASTDSATLTQVADGATVDVLENAVNGWYHVSYNSIVGYMSADYLSVIVNEEDDSSDTAQTDPSVITGNGKVTLSSASSTLNVRAAATSSSASLGTVSAGSVFTLVSYVDGWYQVSYKNQTGYVSAQYITATTDAADDFSLTQDELDAATAANLIATAKKFIGCSYRSGGNGPTSFDCSGFTSYVYRLYGISLSRTAAGQYTSNGTSVSRSDLQAGDIVCFRNTGSSKAATHVGIYVGDGKFIHASTSSGVIISSLSENWYAIRYVGARRVL